MATDTMIASTAHTRWSCHCRSLAAAGTALIVLAHTSCVLAQSVEEASLAFEEFILTPPQSQTPGGEPTPPPPASQLGAGFAISNSCPELDALSGSTEFSAGTQDLLEICTRTVNSTFSDDTSGYGLTRDELLNTLQRVAGDEALAPRTVLVRRQGLPNGVSNRLAVLRSSIRGQRILGAAPRPVQVASTDERAAYPRSLSEGAGGAVAIGPVSVFGDVNYQFGDQDGTEEISPFDHRRIGVTAGADYRFNDRLVAGAAFYASRDRTEFDSTSVSDGGQEIEGRTFGLIGYATYGLPGQVYLEGSAGIARTGFDQTRRIVISSEPGFASGENETAVSDFNSRQVMASGGVGKDIPINRVNVTVAAHANYFRADIDDYEETGAQGLNLAYGEQAISSLTTRLSTQVARPVSRSFGVVVPQVYGAYIHEFKDEEGITVSFANDITSSPTGQPISQYTLTPVEQDANYFVAGAAVSTTLPKGFSGFADFSTLVGLEDFSANRITLGMRKAF